MHDCEYYQDQCAAYLDGELNAADQAELDTHLATCPECAEYLAALRDIGHMLAVDDSEIPSSLHEDIMGVVLADAQSRTRAAQKRHYMPVFTMISAAAVVVLLVMTGTIGDLMGTGRTDSLAGPATMADAGAEAPNTAMFGAPAPTERGVVADNVTPKAEISAAPKSAPAESAAANAADVPHTASAAPRTEQSTPQAEAVAPERTNGSSGKEAATAKSAPMAGAPRAAMMPALPELPAVLQSESFAFCYVATGNGTLPEFGGVLAAESADKAAHYYRVKGTLLEKALTALTEAGYETVSREDAPGVVIDPKAGSGLLIILH